MKLIAFDWDQTLWNSWDIHLRAVHHAATVLDLPAPSESWIASNFSMPFSCHMRMLFPHATREATERYLNFYHSRVKEMGRLFPGVPETLKALKAAGYMLFLLSDKRHVYGSHELESTGIGGLFDHVLFRDGSRAYKPSPQGLNQLVDALSVGKEQVLYVGDSHVDVQCARRSGVASAAALWGSVNVEAVLQAGPDYILHSVEDVLTTLTS